MTIPFFKYLLRKFLLYSIYDNYSSYGNHNFYDNPDHVYCGIIDDYIPESELFE